MPPLPARRPFALLLAAALGAGCSDGPTAPPAPAAYDLVFESFETPQVQTAALWVLRDGTGARARLLPADVAAAQPAASAHGDWLAYLAGGEEGADQLWLARPDGTGRRQVTTLASRHGAPTLAPDGSALAYVAYLGPGPDAVTELRTVRADGTGERTLPTTAGATTRHRNPAWSPDGRRIAFGMGEPGHIALWTIGADGTDLTRLTEPSPAGVVRADVEPSWSPDGRRLVFVRSTSPSQGDLVVLDVATGLARALGLPGSNREPAWSPDGARIAFTARTVENGQVELYTIAPDGTGRVRLTDNDVRERRPAWVARR
jgi:Tol biopolymer transport system component